jgi:hypothetical protein
MSGTLPAGTSTAALQVVMGSVSDSDRKGLAGIHTWEEGRENWCLTVMITEPMLSHHELKMQRGPDGQPVMAHEHNMIQDPLWPVRRGVVRPFNLAQFLTFYFLDEEDRAERIMIEYYEKALLERCAKASGIKLTGISGGAPVN